MCPRRSGSNESPGNRYNRRERNESTGNTAPRGRSSDLPRGVFFLPSAPAIEQVASRRMRPLYRAGNTLWRMMPRGITILEARKHARRKE